MGILILSEDDFKMTNNYAESLRLPKQEIIANKVKNDLPNCDEVWWDITCSLFYLKDAIPEMSRHFRGYPIDYHAFHRNCLPSIVVEDDPALYIPVRQMRMRLRIPLQGRVRAARRDLMRRTITTTASSTWVLPRQADGCYLPKQRCRSRLTSPASSSRASRSWPTDSGTPESLKKFLDKEEQRRRDSELPFERENLSRHLARMSIFRTTTTSIELQPMDFKSGPSIHCEGVLPYYNHHPRVNVRMPWDLFPCNSQRISMLIHVRELNMVVCGSLCGRVALITLTRPRRYHADKPFKRGFRVDAVLPRRSEEEKRIRPHSPLHGVAISPVPDHKARGVDLHRPERGGHPGIGQVYRLILHYLNHDILMYHITRSSRDEDLLVF